MVFQAGYEQTVINRIQLSNCIFQMDYQNQKATMKPNEIFMWCSEQGKFRLRVDILHLACCLTTFHKPTLTFSKWKWKWQKYHSEEPQYKKWTAPFLKDTISMVTLESPDCLTSDQIRSVTQSCPTLCDPMNCGTPGVPLIRCFIYDDVCLSMLLFQFIPLSFHYCVCKSVLYVCISSPTLQIGALVPFF